MYEQKEDSSKASVGITREVTLREPGVLATQAGDPQVSVSRRGRQASAPFAFHVQDIDIYM